MKILFLTRSFNYGGAERQLITLAKSLHQRGHTVAVAAFYSGGPLEEDLREAGIAVHALGKSGRWHVLGFLLELIKLVKRERPDTLHAYLCVPNILATLIAPLFPKMRVAWGVRASNMDLGRYDWTRKAFYRAERWLSRFADLIISNSHAGMQYAIANDFPESKMIVIPNGIDTNRFKVDGNLRRRTRAEFGATASQKLIGVIGRLDPMKGHQTFLEAAAALAAQRDDLLFICVGNGPEDYRSEMIGLGQRLGLTDCLIWSKARRDMPAVYNAMDVIVSASSYGEGFSNIIGEAMACGVACVVTNTGDSAWIVGDTGEVVEPNDAAELSRGIERALERISATGYDPERSRQRVINQFSVTQLTLRSEAALVHLVQE
jgi:glycosyltransferase involved in cell wall biosynthesis